MNGPYINGNWVQKVYFRIHLVGNSETPFEVPKGDVIMHLTNMQSELNYIAQGYLVAKLNTSWILKSHSIFLPECVEQYVYVLNLYYV